MSIFFIIMIFIRRIVYNFFFIIITRAHRRRYNKFVMIFLFKTITSNVINEISPSRDYRIFIIIEKTFSFILNDCLNNFKKFEKRRNIIKSILYKIN